MLRIGFPRGDDNSLERWRHLASLASSPHTAQCSITSISPGGSLPRQEQRLLLQDLSVLIAPYLLVALIAAIRRAARAQQKFHNTMDMQACSQCHPGGRLCTCTYIPATSRQRIYITSNPSHDFHSSSLNASSILTSLCSRVEVTFEQQSPASSEP